MCQRPLFRPLNRGDRLHLDAAQGWLGLGNWQEANEELERITASLRAHPDVLALRLQVYEAAKKWEMAAEIAQAICKLAPVNAVGFIRLAHALHEMKRTREALSVLLPVADKFPDEHIIRYNLACYCCQLGDCKGAWQWLEKAIDLAGTKEVKLMALDDPNLEPLWSEISEI